MLNIYTSSLGNLSGSSKDHEQHKFPIEITEKTSIRLKSLVRLPQLMQP